MLMINDQMYKQDVHSLTSKEKDDVIIRLREKVQSLEEQKNGYRNLSEEIQFAYERMRELYFVQLDKNRLINDENQILLNDIQFLRYQLNQLGGDLGNQMEGNLANSIKAQTIESPLSRKHGGFNPTSSSFSLNLQGIMNNTGNQIINNNDLNPIQKQKISRQYSQLSVNSNNGNTDHRKIMDNEESENIEIFLNNQRNEKKISTGIIQLQTAGAQESLIYSNEKFSFKGHSYPDEISLQNAENEYRKHAKVGELLFQDFLLIGPSLDEVYGKCLIGDGGINKKEGGGQNLHVKNINDQEEVLFSQDILISLFDAKLDQQQKSCVSLHPFPFRVKCKKFKFKKTEDFQQEIVKKIFSETKVSDIHQFAFTMEGENNQKGNRQQVPAVVDISNPMQRQYCIYFEWEDFIFTEKDKNILFKCPFAFCFVTYYPFFTFFRDVFCHVISKLQEDRIALFKINQSNILDKKNAPNGHIYSLDVTWIISEFQKVGSIYCKKLLELQLQKPEDQQIIHFSLAMREDDDEIDSSIQSNINQSKINNLNQPDYSSGISFMIPHYKQLKLLETSQYSCSNLIFQQMSFDDFWMILNIVMLEQHIAFFSQNIQLVAGAIQTFSSIYKPFTKSNRHIIHINEYNFTLLESPIPSLFGINQNSKYIMQNKLICEDSRYVNFVDLDYRKIYLNNFTMKQFEDDNLYMNYSKYMYQLRKAYNILSIQPQRQMAASNFTSFETHSFVKLFNHMVYQSPPIPPNILQSYKNQQQSQLKNSINQADSRQLQMKSQTNIQVQGVTSSSQLYGKNNIADLFSDKGNFVIDKGQFSRLQNEQSEEAKQIQQSYKNQYLKMIKDIKQTALEDLYDFLELTFNHYIIDNLPRELNVDITNKDFKIEEILEKILKKCDEKIFTREFLNTQSFIFYFYQFYENQMIQKPTTSSTKATNSYPSTANPQNKF